MVVASEAVASAAAAPVAVAEPAAAVRQAMREGGVRVVRWRVLLSEDWQDDAAAAAAEPSQQQGGNQLPSVQLQPRGYLRVF